MDFNFKINAEQCSLPVPSEKALQQSQALTQYIFGEIKAAGGWLRFDRYMNLALYAPQLGYYSSGTQKFGFFAKDGSDFFTAPELTPLFTRALARQVAQLFEATGTARILELGAGTGRLAADMLNELEALGISCEKYEILELSADLRQRQQITLTQNAPLHVHKVAWRENLPEHFSGVILGNEVLDAMPVRLYVQHDGSWFEKGVCVQNEQLAFAARPLEGAVPEALKTISTEANYETEWHEAAYGFMRSMSDMLTQGAMLFIDYGFPSHEYYHPQRQQGTLMCHYRHQAHTDPLLYPGLQDITTHIDFSTLVQTALQAGCSLLGYTSQSRFLMNCGIIDLLSAFDPQDPSVFLPIAQNVKRLLSEAEMGELFKVVILGKESKSSKGNAGDQRSKELNQGTKDQSTQDEVSNASPWHDELCLIGFTQGNRSTSLFPQEATD